MLKKRDPLAGQTIASVEVYEDEHGNIDTVVLVMASNKRFSIEANKGYLTVGEET